MALIKENVYALGTMIDRTSEIRSTVRSKKKKNPYTNQTAKLCFFLFTVRAV